MKISNYIKKLSIKYIVIVSSVLALVGGGIAWNRYQAYKANFQAKQEMMYTVKTGDLQVQVKVNAKASLVDEQNLSFGQEGKIVSVNVNVGDEVKAGDVLAELDLKDYDNAIQAAQLELENAQLGLSKLYNNDTSVAEARIRSQIKEAELSLEIESEQYGILKKQLADALQQKNDELVQLNDEYVLAEKALDIGVHGSAELPVEQDRQQKVQTIVSDLRSILGDVEMLVESVDKIFGVTETFKHEAEPYYMYISAKTTDFKNQTEANVLKGYSFVRTFEPKIDAINTSTSDNDIYGLVQDFYNESEILVTLCDTALDAFDMSVVGVDLPQGTLDGFETTVSTSRSTAIALRTELKTLKDSVNDILSSYDTQKVSLQSQNNAISLLTKEIETLEKDNKNQLARKSAQIENLKEQISVSNQELRDVMDGVDAYDIKQQQNLISQAELKLERTKNQQDDYQIIAEFDGRVRTVDIVAGEQYKLDDKKYIVVENPNLIELKLQVSQIDIVKIKEGQSVVVTFDAYPNTPIEAIVTSRNVNPQPNQRGGVYYEAVVVLEKQELEILAGMSAIVTVNVAEVKNAIVIPTLAIVHQNNKTYVHLKQKANTYALHEIQIGISNNFQAEVLSGLQVGDVVLASVLDEAVLKEMGITDGAALSISF